jgi:amino acid efflux transporter
MTEEPMTRPSPELPGLSEGAPSAPRLRKAIRTRNAIALYVSSVLGSGILVLPGLAARIAGAGSLFAWAFLAIASIPFALTFASLSARRPESGGVYAFAKEAFGPLIGTVTGWLFALWVVIGAPAVALIAAAYMAYAFPLDRPETYILGFSIIAAAFAINYRGIVLSNRVQLAVIASIVALLVITIVVSGSRVQPGNFQPILPYGLASIGTASALIFWSFLGYENVSNVAEEFENPTRDFPRSVFASVGIIGVLYFAIAFVTVGTGAYKGGGGVAPFATLLGAVFGPYGAAITSLMAVFIVFGVVNAYTTGMSRVMFATARDGGFPRILAHVDPRTGVPNHALIALLGGASTVFVVYYFGDVSLTTALLAASGAAITVYVIGSAAGVQLLGKTGIAGRYTRGLAVISLVISLVVAPFIGWALAVSLIAVVGAFLYYTFVSPKGSVKWPS